MLLLVIQLVMLGILFYAWIGYQLLLSMFGRKHAGAVNLEQTQSLPMRVVVMMSAYNEENVIAARLENLVRSVSHQFSVLVGVDGSTDRTAEIAREFAARHDNVRVFEFKERRGKVAVIKDLVKKSEEGCGRRLTPINADKTSLDILVFTDANTIFRPDALEKLLGHFSDPDIGGVCGRLVFVENCRMPNVDCRMGNSEIVNHQSEIPNAEAFYWRWETMLKERESALDSCLGANGAIYAVRSELFRRDIPDNTIVDDFVVGMKIREQGYRMIYDGSAVAEEDFPRAGDEWNRRVRIGTGDYQALSLCWRCLLPQYGLFAWIFLSHKVLRWFTPHMMLVLVAGSLLSVAGNGLFAGSGIPLIVLMGMAGLVFCSMVGSVPRQGRTHRVMAKINFEMGFRFFRLCHHFMAMNVALFVGSLRFLGGDLKGQWERTPRR